MPLKLLITPSYSTQVAGEQKVIRARFGDRYEQRSPDGINAVAQMWTMVWANIPRLKARDVITFLETVGGVSAFIWTPPAPHDVQRMWTVDDGQWSHRYNAYDNETVECTFRQDFAAAARCATPTFTPADFTPGPATVTMACATPGSIVRYTTDESLPTLTHGTTYSAPLAGQDNLTFTMVGIHPTQLDSAPAILNIL